MLLPFLPRDLEAGTQVYPVESSSLEHTDVTLPVKEDGKGENALTVAMMVRRSKDFIVDLISFDDG